MTRSAPEPLGWFGDDSDSALRSAVRDVAPHLADLAIEREHAPDLSNPTWAFSRALIGRRVFGKFAFSEPTATRIWHEAQVLELLGAGRNMAVPRLLGACPNPAFLLTEFVPGGAPLAYATVAAAGPDHIALFATQLARFLSELHALETLGLAQERLDRLRPPDASLQISTDQLRTRLMTMIEPGQRSMVGRWCDWVDEQSALPADVVFVHGDLHPYNQLWDLQDSRLLAITDFETSWLAEPEFDFRILPVYGPGVELLTSTMKQYEAMSGRTLSLERIMALHLLNYLGDALWRTTAGVALPPPGTTPAAYVKEAADRLAALGINP